MKALILDNKVVQVSETEFPVHESMVWVDCGEAVKVGYSYFGGVFAAPIEALQTQSSIAREQIAALEAQVTPRRMREATLTDDGKLWLTNIETQIAALRGSL